MSTLERTDRDFGEYNCRRSKRQAGVDDDYDVKTEAYNLWEIRALTGNQWRFLSIRCDVNMWRCTDYKMGCTVLDSGVCQLRETS